MKNSARNFTVMNPFAMGNLGKNMTKPNEAVFRNK